MWTFLGFLPVREDEAPHKHPQVLPEAPLGPQLLPARPVEMIGQLEDLVHEEGEEVQKKEVEGKMLFPVAEIVFYVVSLVLQRIQRLVLDLPSAPADPTSSSTFFSWAGRSLAQALW